MSVILLKHTSMGKRAHILAPDEVKDVDGKPGYIKHNDRLYEEIPGEQKATKKPEATPRDDAEDDSEYATKDMVPKKRSKKSSRE